MSAHSVDPGVRKYFDETVAYWDQIYAGHSFINWHLADRRHLVIDAVRRFSDGSPLKALDLGSGTGVLTRDLMRMGHSVIALDCSQNMIRALKESLGDRPQPSFLGAVIGTANETCLKSEAFDLIICIGVIQYQRSPETVFQEIRRLLKPGGICVFTVPNQLSVHHLLDPWCVLRWLWRLMIQNHGSGGSLQKSCRAALESSASIDDVYEKRYFRRDIPALARMLTVRETTGFGYGPITIANKSVLPDRISIALSTAVAKLSAHRAFSWLSILANRWVIVLEKPSS